MIAERIPHDVDLITLSYLAEFLSQTRFIHEHYVSILIRKLTESRNTREVESRISELEEKVKQAVEETNVVETCCEFYTLLKTKPPT